MSNSEYMLSGKHWSISWPDGDEDVNIFYDEDIPTYDSDYANFYVDGKELYKKLKEHYGD